MSTHQQQSLTSSATDEPDRSKGLRNAVIALYHLLPHRFFFTLLFLGWLLVYLLAPYLLGFALFNEGYEWAALEKDFILSIPPDIMLPEPTPTPSKDAKPCYELFDLVSPTSVNAQHRRAIFAFVTSKPLSAHLAGVLAAYLEKYREEWTGVTPLIATMSDPTCFSEIPLALGNAVAILFDIDTPHLCVDYVGDRGLMRLTHRTFKGLWRPALTLQGKSFPQVQLGCDDPDDPPSDLPFEFTRRHVYPGLRILGDRIYRLLHEPNIIPDSSSNYLAVRSQQWSRMHHPLGEDTGIVRDDLHPRERLRHFVQSVELQRRNRPDVPHARWLRHRSQSLTISSSPRPLSLPFNHKYLYMIMFQLAVGTSEAISDVTYRHSKDQYGLYLGEPFHLINTNVALFLLYPAPFFLVLFSCVRLYWPLKKLIKQQGNHSKDSNYSTHSNLYQEQKSTQPLWLLLYFLSFVFLLECLVQFSAMGAPTFQHITADWLQWPTGIGGSIFVMILGTLSGVLLSMLSHLFADNLHTKLFMTGSLLLYASGALSWTLETHPQLAIGLNFTLLPLLFIILHLDNPSRLLKLVLCPILLSVSLILLDLFLPSGSQVDTTMARVLLPVTISLFINPSSQAKGSEIIDFFTA